ncbi:Segregation and condensation protein A [hydrothermal vent metagenome]|uniref:Segregation and condensation protein A n=1 Tax=hydrothermal vent metagenome TaxID=652676 RepID=A0A3B1CZ01_9ZZZZ
MNYKLKLDVFEGPLDLLLYLIKKDDIDIGDIPIVEVTEQYMEYIDMMKMLDLDVVGDFLVMAATLMHIKSKMLLPPDPMEEEEEEIDPRDELARRLHEYKKFKEVADALKEKESDRQDLFQRAIDEEAQNKLKIDSREIYFEPNLFDLINAFSEALKKVPEEILHEVMTEEFTVEQKIHDVLHRLLDGTSIVLTKLFTEARSKVEAIVTFLAVLELIRLKEIKAMQKRIFGDIEIMRNKDNMLPVENAKAE